MKDLTTIPTAELLAEWSAKLKFAMTATFCMGWKPRARRSHLKKIDTIAAELDRRTVGMNLMDGMPEISIDQVSILKQMTLPPKPVAVKINIPIDELIERLKWLQIKGGK